MKKKPKHINAILAYHLIEMAKALLQEKDLLQDLKEFGQKLQAQSKTQKGTNERETETS